MQLFHVPTLGEDIGHLIQGAIDDHQLQTEGKGSLGLWSSERPATLSEALTHHHGSQALLPCGQTQRKPRLRWAKTCVTLALYPGEQGQRGQRFPIWTWVASRCRSCLASAQEASPWALASFPLSAHPFPQGQKWGEQRGLLGSVVPCPSATAGWSKALASSHLPRPSRERPVLQRTSPASGTSWPAWASSR